MAIRKAANGPPDTPWDYFCTGWDFFLTHWDFSSCLVQALLWRLDSFPVVSGVGVPSVTGVHLVPSVVRVVSFRMLTSENFLSGEG